MSDRETVLGRIAARATRHAGVRPHDSRDVGSDPIHALAAGHDPHPATARAPAQPAPPAALIEQFVAEFEMLTGIVHHVASAEAAVAAVVGVCARHGSSRVLAWEERWCGAPGLDEGLRRAGIDADRGWLPTDPASRLARLAVLETILVGVTGAAGAIAESGTIALFAGPGRPRTASLLPPVHVAILPAASLFPTLAAFLAAHPDAAEEGSNLVLITGPSRTADIEMTLTRGVHGPGEVHVVLLRS